MKFINSPFAIQEKRINSLDKKRNLIYDEFWRIDRDNQRNINKST